MAETKARDLATSLGQAVRKNNITTAGGLSVSGLTTYTTKANLPSGYDSDNAGSLGFTTDSDKLYIHTGQGWFNIGIINTNPIWITQPENAYTLATDATAYNNGTATTVIARARDSEGMSITWTDSADAAMNNIANISRDSNSGEVMKWTIEPATQDSAGSAMPASGSFAFKASDGINVISHTATFNLTFDTTIDNSEDTAFYLKAHTDNATNDTVTDHSSGSHTITVNNDATPGTFSPYSPTYYSWFFDGAVSPFTGNADAITVSDHSDLVLGTGDFTIECWAMPQKDNSYAVIITDSLYGSSGGWRLYQYADRWSWCVSGTEKGLSMTAGLSQGSIFCKKNHWYHIAIVKASGTVTCYINGYIIGTYSESTNLTDDQVVIGGSEDGAGYGFCGYIRDVRVVKGTPVYTGVFTPPIGPLTQTGGDYGDNTTNVNTSITAAHTVLLTCQDPYLVDNSATPKTLTANNDVSCHPISPFKVKSDYVAATHGGSIYLDGTGDHLSFGTHADFNVGSGAWTIECWIYPTKLDDAYTALLDMRGSGTSLTPGLWIYTQSNTGKMVYFNNDGEMIQGTFGDVKRNQWYHVAVAKTGTSTKMFLNGVQNGSTYTDNKTYVQPSDTSRIGRRIDDIRHFDGFISDFRFTKGTARYTSNFTPPTAPVGTDSNTKLYLRFSEANIYDVGGRANWDFFEGADVHTGQQKFSTPSFQTTANMGSYAAGDNEWVGVAARLRRENWHLMPRGRNFTWEAWIYIDAVQGSYSGGVWAARTNNATVNGPGLFMNSDDKLYWYDNGSVWTTTEALSANTWYHIAVVRNGNDLACFKDGVLMGNTSGNDDLDDNSGDHQDYYVDGDNANGYLHGHGFGSGTGGSSITYSRPKLEYRAKYPFYPDPQTMTTSKSFQHAIGNASHTKLLCCHHATITTDGSATGHTITAQGDPAVVRWGPGPNMYSVYFDGTGDYLELADHADWDFGTGDFTIDGWLYPTASTSQMFIIGKWQSPYDWAVQTANDADRHPRFLWHTGGGSYNDTASAGAMLDVYYPINEWSHFAFTRDGNQLRFFIDGQCCHDLTRSEAHAESTSKLTIGGTVGGGQLFTGYMSNIRIIKGSCLYKKNFTVPTAHSDG